MGNNPYIKNGEILRIKRGGLLRNSVTAAQNIDTFILVDGVCSLSTFTQDGKSSVLLFFEPGDFVGYAPFLINEYEFELLAQSYLTGLGTFCETNCTVSRLSKPVLDELKNDLGFERTLSKNIFSQHLRMIAVRRTKTDKSSPASVAAFILFQSRPSNDGMLSLAPFFTYEEIAKVLEIHPVSVGRIIGALKKEGAIKRDGRAITVTDRELLVAIASDEHAIEY